MTTWWQRVIRWFTWPGDEPENPEGNRPETVEWRRKRREMVATTDNLPKRRRSDLYDPYPDQHQRPRIRLVVIGGPFMQTVNMGGWSAEDYPFDAKGADKQLAAAVEVAIVVVDAKLVIHERKKAQQALERERLKAERAYERAIEKEAADRRRAEKETHEPPK